MKKIILSFALSLGVCISSSYAKTEGPSIGFDFIKAEVEHNYTGLLSGHDSFDDSSSTIGVNFKYAYNLDRMFISPSVFYEAISTESIDQDNDNVKIDGRAGAKVDLGYDISDKFSAYVTAGLAAVSYEVNWLGGYVDGNEVGAIYGAGLNYRVQENIGLSIEYNMQNLELETPDSAFGGDSFADTDISTIKVGVSYLF